MDTVMHPSTPPPSLSLQSSPDYSCGFLDCQSISWSSLRAFTFAARPLPPQAPFSLFTPLFICQICVKLSDRKSFLTNPPRPCLTIRAPSPTYIRVVHPDPTTSAMWWALVTTSRLLVDARRIFRCSAQVSL